MEEVAEEPLDFQRFYVMTSSCVKCRQPITVADGAFFVAGDPYFAAMHRRCAPFFVYDKEWPHPYPFGYYMKTQPPQ
jgi:hypothetical protein